MLKFNYFSINHIDLHTYTGENFDSEKRSMCNFFIFLNIDNFYLELVREKNREKIIGILQINVDHKKLFYTTKIT